MITTNTSLKALSHLLLMLMMTCSSVSVVFSQQTLSSSCTSLKRMDVHDRGIQHWNNYLNVTLGSGTNKVTIECTCRDVAPNVSICPSSIIFTIRRPNGTTQNISATRKNVTAIGYTGDMESSIYRAVYNGEVNRVTYNPPSSATARSGMRGLVVWEESEGRTPNIPNNYRVDKFLYGESMDHYINVPTSSCEPTRDFVISVPIHEHGSDGRHLVYHVRAFNGNSPLPQLVNRTITANNSQGEIRLDQIALNNVPANANRIRVYIESPGNFVGTSIIVGSIMATSEIPFLPVELSGFKAIPEGVYNKISWTTDTELNTDYFELERRIQGGGWKRIERIDAAGYSESTKSYSCLDEFPIAENYYRLKSVDIDGSFEYSDVIYLDRKDLNILLSNIYINQISDNLIIRFNTDLSTEKASIELFDVNGRTIYKLTDTPLIESGEFMIDINNYPAGVYFISVYVNDSRQIEKVIKQ